MGLMRMSIDWDDVIGDLEDLREKVIFKTQNENEKEIYDTIEYLHFLIDEYIRLGEIMEGSDLRS
jgi:hypothetical protein